MTKLFTTLSIVALLAMTGHAVAQATTEEAAPEAESAPVTEENAEIGQIYEKSTHGDWNVRCVRTPLGQEDQCEMYVVVRAPDQQPVSEFTLTRVPETKEVVALASVRTPLEVLLPPGIAISIDDKPAGRVPFVACTRQFCQAEIQLREKDVAVFKRGAASVLNVVVRTDPPQEIGLNISLKGFTAAYSSLPEPKPAAAPAPAPAGEQPAPPSE